MSPAARAKLDGEAIRARLAPVVAELGYDLEEVTAQRAGSRQLLRLTVDADGGVTLDDIAEVSQAVSAALDESNAMGEAPYDLEVTSPGVSRPLTLPRHWRRNAGRLVLVALAAGGELTGRIIEVDDEGIELELPGKKPGQPGTRRRLAFAELGKGKVQVEFNRPGPKDTGADGEADDPSDEDFADDEFADEDSDEDLDDGEEIAGGGDHEDEDEQG